MKQGNGLHAMLACANGGPGCLILQVIGLCLQQAGHHLKVIFYTNDEFLSTAIPFSSTMFSSDSFFRLISPAEVVISCCFSASSDSGRTGRPGDDQQNYTPMVSFRRPF